MTDLSYIELCGLKAKAGVNFSMREIGIGSLDDCGVQFENMRTLACELQMRKLKDPSSVKLSMEELLDSDELKKVYTIPLTLKNGQEVMAIVDNSGRSMAIELKDEEGKSNNFIISSRLKNEIMKNPKEIQKMLTSEGLAKHFGLEEEFVPQNIDELAEGIEKKNLIPTKDEVEEKGKIEKEDYDPEKVKGKDVPQKAEEAEEEVDLDKVAIAAGVSKDAIEKFIEAEGIKDKNQIKGIKPVRDIDGLESLLNKKLPKQNSTVLVLKTKGTISKDRGYIIDTDGNKLVGNEGRVNQVAEEIVPEHTCSEAINDMADAKNVSGEKVDKAAYFASRKDFIKKKFELKKEEIESSKGKKSDYHTEMAELAYECNKELEDLKLEASGLDLDAATQDVVNEIGSEAEAAKDTEGYEYEEAGKAETVETITGVVGTAIAGIAKGITEKDDERDPREQHGNSHDEGRIPPWMQN